MPWSFRGLSFGVAAPESIFDEWFKTTTRRTIDDVLSTTIERYVDIGAISVEPMTFTAQWSGDDAWADRQTLIGYRSTVGTLVDDAGRSCQALLADTTPIRVVASDSGYVRMAVTFEFVSD